MNNHKFSYQLKEASDIDARATPPTIGRREPTTQGVGIYSCITENDVRPAS